MGMKSYVTFDQGPNLTYCFEMHVRMYESERQTYIIQNIVLVPH